MLWKTTTTQSAPSPGSYGKAHAKLLALVVLHISKKKVSAS